MKSGALKLLLVVIGINIFFAYIGIYFLPQSESRPPKVLKISEGIPSDELVLIGEKIVFGKGMCMVCHPMKAETGMRSPAIATIGKDVIKSAEKRGDITPEEYLLEALVNPSGHVQEGYEDMMPAVHKSPTELNEGELIAVAAYLQSNGSRVTLSYPGSVKLLKGQIDKAGGE